MLTPATVSLPSTSRTSRSDSESCSHDSSASSTTPPNSCSAVTKARISTEYSRPKSIRAWTEDLSPYGTTEERLAMRLWLDFAPSMGRSIQGLSYWAISIPTIAWDYAPVRNAVTATSLVYRSLRKKESPVEFAMAKARGLEYANRCIRELLDTGAPPEVMITCSSLFWIFEMLLGNWYNSMMHLASGARIARGTKLNDLSDPLTAQYIRSFVSDLPASIHPESIIAMSRQQQAVQSGLRHRYARLIMCDALDRLGVFQEKLQSSKSSQRDQAVQIVERTAGELHRLSRGWPESPTVRYDEPSAVQKAILEHSPYISILEDAYVFFIDDDIKHIYEFETKFQPCIDYFIWLAACQQLAQRQHVIEVWNVKRAVLPRTNRLLPTTDTEDA